MKSRTAGIALGVVFAALIAGVVILFRWRLASGDVFPAYSSLRADPLGVRALHDSLAQLPGIRVDRNFKSLESISARPARTILMPGMTVRAWNHIGWPAFDAIEAAVRSGCRVIVAFRAPDGRDIEADEPVPEKADAKRKTEKKPPEEKADPNDIRAPKFADMGRRWGAVLKQRRVDEAEKGAIRAEADDLVGLPARFPSRSEIFFENRDPAWRILYRRGSSPVMVERRLGQGSIVLAADSYFLSNEALQRDRSTPLLAWVIGPNFRVVFDESHLGVEVNPGIAALARQYGLAAAFGTFVLLAFLFVWRESARFVPPGEEIEEVALSYHPAAGLERLLQRAIPPAEIAAACLADWRKTASESDRARVDALLAGSIPLHPVAFYNAVVKALRKH